MELLAAQLDTLKSQLAAQQAPLEAAQEAHATARYKRERHSWGVSHHDERFLRQQQRLERRVERTLAQMERVRGQQAALLVQVEDLMRRLAALAAENAALPVPVALTIRLDAGFSTDANLTWLIEMGSTVLTNMHSGHTTTRLQRRCRCPWARP